MVSNREPYIHNYDAQDRVLMQVPACGMVTALEPVVRTCAGIWIAHGGGSADRSVVDRHDHIRVPLTDPSYILRRVQLSKEQEDGYYYGLSSEGLWPLCHLAYMRDAFRERDSLAYVQVNNRFAEVAAQESKSADPKEFGAAPAKSLNWRRASQKKACVGAVLH